MKLLRRKLQKIFEISLEMKTTTSVMVFHKRGATSCIGCLALEERFESKHSLINILWTFSHEHLHRRAGGAKNPLV